MSETPKEPITNKPPIELSQRPPANRAQMLLDLFKRLRGNRHQEEAQELPVDDVLQETSDVLEPVEDAQPEKKPKAKVKILPERTKNRQPPEEYLLAQARKKEARDILQMPFDSLKVLLAIKLKTLIYNGLPPVQIDDADKPEYGAIVELMEEATSRRDLSELALLAQEKLGRSMVNDRTWSSLLEIDLEEFIRRCRDENLPETITEGKQFELDGCDKVFNAGGLLPWVEAGDLQVELKSGTTQAGNKFYVGNLVEGRALENAQGKLVEQHRKNIDHMFYSRIQGFIDGSSLRVSKLINAITKEPIYYFGNDGGQRTYFMRINRPDFDAPIIIRVANCDKSTQLPVLKTLTDQDERNIKKFAKL